MSTDGPEDVDQHNADAWGLPAPPEIDETLMQRCRERGDFCPVLFEWYQYIGATCSFFSRIQRDSSDIKRLPALNYAVLIALLNRCARLMISNIKLSDQGLFGETTVIIDRCIFESVVKLQWLCHKGDDASFRRFVLDGLKPDVEFRANILAKIQSRGGEPLNIEARMLASVDSYLAAVPTTAAEVDASPKMLDLASMIDAIGHDRLVYVVGQRLGSHHVHGTWPALYRDYLEDDGAGNFAPRDHDCPTNANQYIYVMTLVLDALRAFTDFVAQPGEGHDALTTLLEAASADLEQLRAEIVGADFDTMEAA